MKSNFALVCGLALLVPQLAQASFSQVGIGTNSPVCMLDVEASSTGYLADTFGMWVNNTVNPSAAAPHGFYGSVGRATSTSGFTVSSVFGVAGQCVANSAATISNATGVTGEIYNNSTGTITNAMALRGVVNNTSSGTITNAFGVYINAPTNSGGGTISNYYGLYINEPTGATNNYSIYSSGGTNYFGGSIGIGANPSQGKLWIQDGDLWLTGNAKVAISSDESTDSTPNVSIGASSNDTVFSNWNGSAYNETMRIVGNSAKVGIGTNAPSATLDVNGTIRAGTVTTGAACTAIGAQGYNSSTGAPLYCSSSLTWTLVGAGGCRLCLSCGGTWPVSAGTPTIWDADWSSAINLSYSCAGSLSFNSRGSGHPPVLCCAS